MAIAYFSPEGRPHTHDASRFGGTISFYLEVWFLATAGTVYARLYDDDAAAEVAASVVSTAAGAYARQLSAACSLTDGHTYRFELGAEGAGTGLVKGVSRILGY